MTTPDCVPAVDRLLDLACETRRDLDRQALHGLVLDLQANGWTWPQTLVGVMGMCARGEDLRDLRNACRTAVRRRGLTTT